MSQPGAPSDDSDLAELFIGADGVLEERIDGDDLLTAPVNPDR